MSGCGLGVGPKDKAYNILIKSPLIIFKVVNPRESLTGRPGVEEDYQMAWINR